MAGQKKKLETRIPGSRGSASLPRHSVLHLLSSYYWVVSALHLRRVFMSQHRSLKGASTIAVKRNVLKRFERVELLKKRGVFKPGDKVIGLPKTKPDA